MKNKTRSWLMFFISVGVIIILAIVDILDNGMFTTGFIGMLVLIIGALLIPTILKLIKEKNEKSN